MNTYLETFLTFQIHVFPPPDDLSPLQLHDDILQGLDNSLPTSYTTSLTRPGVKRTQPETGHRNSISDRQ